VEHSLVNNEFGKAEATTRLAEIAIERAELEASADEQNRELSASEARKLKRLDGEAADLQDRLDRAATMERELARVPRDSASYGTRARIGHEPSTVYRPDLANSFFRDLVQRGQNPESETRIRRHIQESGVEQRAMTSASGSGIGLVPPQYLQDLIATYARAGRTAANRCQSLPLPDSGTVFNIPRVTTGLVTAVQTAEAAAANDSSAVTDTIALTISTIAGKVDVSRQLFDRSNPSSDTVLAQDLSNDYNKQLDLQVVNGTGASGQQTGLLVQSGVNAITFTNATPTLPLLWPKLADAVRQVANNRFLPADTILVSALKWGWLVSGLDSSNRPFITPSAGNILNAMGLSLEPTAEGAAGAIQGLPVFVDPNMPTNKGAGTNEDWIVAARLQDSILFEDPNGPTVAVYDGVLSANLQIRIMAYGYIAFTCNRYPKAVSVVSGTGLITPAL
jgi:HK97 family phage major capsid protein